VLPAGTVTGMVAEALPLLAMVTLPFCSVALTVPAASVEAQPDCWASVCDSVASVTCESGAVYQLLYWASMSLIRLMIV
jgi:hypothetical protein